MPKLNGWELDNEGSIIVRPLVGYSTMIAAGMTVLLRLENLEAEDQFETPSGWKQLAMTPAQAEHLARALLHAVSKAAGQPSPEGKAS